MPTRRGRAAVVIALALLAGSPVYGDAPTARKAAPPRATRSPASVDAPPARSDVPPALPARSDVPPALASPAAVVLDAATGAEIYGKHADDVRPIASMTKIFVALALRRRHLDLERWTEINFDDAKAAAGGAHTLLLEGQAFRNRDLLYAMLLSSDNRVPSALARSVGLSSAELVSALGKIAADLGLSHTRFDDATGIQGNASTAREMALALRETLRDRLLAQIMTTRHAQVVSRSEEITARYTSTVRPLWESRYKILGGKTGHTDGAGYCLLIEAEIGGRPVVIALLGGKTEGARFDDFAHLAAWLNAAVPPRAAVAR